LPTVLGDLLVRLGRTPEARIDFERAAAMTLNERERQLLLKGASEGRSIRSNKPPELLGRLPPNVARQHALNVAELVMA
jgi:hypothetical protein